MPPLPVCAGAAEASLAACARAGPTTGRRRFYCVAAAGVPTVAGATAGAGGRGCRPCWAAGRRHGRAAGTATDILTEPGPRSTVAGCRSGDIRRARGGRSARSMRRDSGARSHTAGWPGSPGSRESPRCRSSWACCLRRAADLRPVRAPRAAAGGGPPGGAAARLGRRLPPLRPRRRAALRGRLLPLPLGRVSLRTDRHAVRRGAGGVLHGPDGTRRVPAHPGPGQLPGAPDHLRPRHRAPVPGRLRACAPAAWRRCRPCSSSATSWPSGCCCGSRRRAPSCSTRGARSWSRRSPSPRIPTSPPSACCWPPSPRRSGAACGRRPSSWGWRWEPRCWPRSWCRSFSCVRARRTGGCSRRCSRALYLPFVTQGGTDLRHAAGLCARVGVQRSAVRPAQRPGLPARPRAGHVRAGARLRPRLVLCPLPPFGRGDRSRAATGSTAPCWRCGPVVNPWYLALAAALRGNPTERLGMDRVGVRAAGVRDGNEPRRSADGPLRASGLGAPRGVRLEILLAMSYDAMQTVRRAPAGRAPGGA